VLGVIFQAVIRFDGRRIKRADPIIIGKAGRADANARFACASLSCLTFLNDGSQARLSFLAGVEAERAEGFSELGGEALLESGVTIHAGFRAIVHSFICAFDDDLHPFFPLLKNLIDEGLTKPFLRRDCLLNRCFLDHVNDIGIQFAPVDDDW
jgi:hypothetical protein